MNSPPHVPSSTTAIEEADAKSHTADQPSPPPPAIPTENVSEKLEHWSLAQPLKIAVLAGYGHDIARLLTASSSLAHDVDLLYALQVPSKERVLSPQVTYKVAVVPLLHAAASAGRVDRVLELLDAASSDAHLLEKRDAKGQTPLIAAAIMIVGCYSRSLELYLKVKGVKFDLNLLSRPRRRPLTLTIVPAGEAGALAALLADRRSTLELIATEGIQENWSGVVPLTAFGAACNAADAEGAAAHKFMSRFLLSNVGKKQEPCAFTKMISVFLKQPFPNARRSC
jgi:hypothetical protein